MKFVIKLSVGPKGRFKLQSRGNIPGRQFLTAAGLLASLERALLRTGNEEKIEIIIKEYIGGHFENINESLASNNGEYLLYTTSCFLEDYISKPTLRKAEKSWTKGIKEGGQE